MKLNPALQMFVTFPGRLGPAVWGMFNLNDPRWGRDDDKSASEEGKPESNADDRQPPKPSKPPGKGPNQAWLHLQQSSRQKCVDTASRRCLF